LSAILRDNYLIDDVQSVFLALFNQYASDTTPFTRWDIVRGFPNSSIFDEKGTALIYITKPLIVEIQKVQGQNKPNYVLDLSFGIWVDSKEGGEEEQAIMISQLTAKFATPNTIYKKTFNVTLGAVTSSNKTLLNCGIKILGITGSRTIETTNPYNEFRSIIDIRIKTF